MPHLYTALPTDEIRALQAGGPDAHGMAPETAISDGDCPCRHCLRFIPAGRPMLILAFRPFPEPQPYAETGPIFLCAGACVRGGGPTLPEVVQAASSVLMKGYRHNDRILYGTGSILLPGEIAARAGVLFRDPEVAYLHIRSSRNNCYSCRVDRAA